jgi:hypothetical protein
VFKKMNYGIVVCLAARICQRTEHCSLKIAH